MKYLLIKNIWLERLNVWLKVSSARREWGEFFIPPVYTSNMEIRGWLVRYPSTLDLPKYNKAFMCSTLGGQYKAFASAVQYIDKILSDIDTF